MARSGCGRQTNHTCRAPASSIPGAGAAPGCPGSGCPCLAWWEGGQEGPPPQHAPWEYAHNPALQPASSQNASSMSGDGPIAVGDAGWKRAPGPGGVARLGMRAQPATSICGTRFGPGRSWAVARPRDAWVPRPADAWRPDPSRHARHGLIAQACRSLDPHRVRGAVQFGPEQAQGRAAWESSFLPRASRRPGGCMASTHCSGRTAVCFKPCSASQKPGRLPRSTGLLQSIARRRVQGKCGAVVRLMREVPMPAAAPGLPCLAIRAAKGAGNSLFAARSTQLLRWGRGERG